MSEEDYDNQPGIAITQWREGRVLSADDIKLIERLLREHDSELMEDVDRYHAARTQVLHEIGGQGLVDAAAKADFATSQISLKRAYASYAAKCAELDSMKN